MLFRHQLEFSLAGGCPSHWVMSVTAFMLKNTRVMSQPVSDANGHILSYRTIHVAFHSAAQPSLQVGIKRLKDLYKLDATSALSPLNNEGVLIYHRCYGIAPSIMPSRPGDA